MNDNVCVRTKFRYESVFNSCSYPVRFVYCQSTIQPDVQLDGSGVTYASGFEFVWVFHQGEFPGYDIQDSGFFFTWEGSFHQFFKGRF